MTTPALSALTATPGINQITLGWVVTDPDLVLTAIEIWASSTNDVTTASNYGEVGPLGTGFTHFISQQSTAGFYYWIRGRAADGSYPTGWQPADPLGGVGAVLRGFADWSPNPISTSGSLGAGVTTPEARYTQVGHIVFFHLNIYIPDNGSGAGKIRFTLPVNSNFARGFPLGVNIIGSMVCYGDSLVANKALKGSQVALSASTCDVTFYDGNYPGSSGETLSVSGWYETVSD